VEVDEEVSVVVAVDVTVVGEVVVTVLVEVGVLVVEVGLPVVVVEHLSQQVKLELLEDLQSSQQIGFAALDAGTSVIVAPRIITITAMTDNAATRDPLPPELKRRPPVSYPVQLTRA
jgi:hypothetical protein